MTDVVALRRIIIGVEQRMLKRILALEAEIAEMKAQAAVKPRRGRPRKDVADRVLDG